MFADFRQRGPKKGEGDLQELHAKRKKNMEAIDGNFDSVIDN